MELRDERDEPLYRQTLHEPISEDLEVVADDGVSLARVPRENVVGRFSVVVPDLSAAQAVSFVGPADSPARGRRADAGARALRDRQGGRLRWAFATAS